MEYIAKELINQAITYEQYRELSTRLLQEGKSTAFLSGNAVINDSTAILEYTRLNEQRMNRLDKTFKLDPVAAEWLAELDTPLLLLTLTESWCGDAAQIIPVVHGMTRSVAGMHLRLLMRDQHPELMDAFLTNGGRSIPKFIIVDPATLQVLGSWGPRPEAVQAIMTEYKGKLAAATDPAERKALNEEAKTLIHTWYARDKTVSTQRELAGQLVGVM